MSVIATTIDRVLERVNAIGTLKAGFSRPSYSPEEGAAHEVIADEARHLGLTPCRDAAGNLAATLRGADPERTPLVIGSHLDTVHAGGAYDGTAGVAAGVALLAALREGGGIPPADIMLMVTRAEESVWFPVSYIGSRAALGRLTRADLDVVRADTGRPLADHMRDAGLDPEAAVQAPAPRPARFLEMHIEQGPVLHSADEPFALVTGVRGGLRYRTARIDGVWAHSGGAPREGRADAVVAFAELVRGMNAAWDAVLAQGHDLAVTFGRVDAAGPLHAMAKVAGTLGFCLDMRSDDPAVLERADAMLAEVVARIECETPGIKVDLGSRSRSTPVPLSAGMADGLDRAARRLGHAPRRMLSGGGHDAAAFAAAGWDSAMMFIRNWNGSHCPEEGMDQADLARAVEVVHAAVTEGDL